MKRSTHNLLRTCFWLSIVYFGGMFVYSVIVAHNFPNLSDAPHYAPFPFSLLVGVLFGVVFFIPLLVILWPASVLALVALIIPIVRAARQPKLPNQ